MHNFLPIIDACCRHCDQISLLQDFAMSGAVARKLLPSLLSLRNTTTSSSSCSLCRPLSSSAPFRTAAVGGSGAAVAVGAVGGAAAAAEELQPLAARRLGAPDGSQGGPADPRSAARRRGKRTRAWELGSMKPLGADIVSAGAPVLRQAAEEVPESMLDSDELRELVQNMMDTMRAAPGVGLAAPQIGVPLQVIVMEDKAEYIELLPDGVAEQQQRLPFETLVIINPRLTALTDEGVRFFEGCLSVPNYQALVERYLSVEVEGLTVEGRPLKLHANGWKARILQHEVDHLRGTLYVDRMLTRSFARRGSLGRLPDDVPRPGPCKCCHPVDRAAGA